MALGSKPVAMSCLVNFAAAVVVYLAVIFMFMGTTSVTVYSYDLAPHEMQTIPIKHSHQVDFEFSSKGGNFTAFIYQQEESIRVARDTCTRTSQCSVKGLSYGRNISRPVIANVGDNSQIVTVTVTRRHRIEDIIDQGFYLIGLKCLT